MKKTRTLRQLRQDFQEGKKLLIGEDSKWESMTDFQRRKLTLERRGEMFIKSEMELRCTGEMMFLNNVLTLFNVKGNSEFYKRETTNILYIKGNTLKVKRCCSFSDIMKIFDIKWIDGIVNKYEHFLWKPQILKAILTGRIYSEETLIRRIFSNNFKIKLTDWKIGKEYLNNSNVISLTTLSAITDDVNKAMRQILSFKEDHCRLLLMRDIADNALLLQKKVNFKWSIARMQAEHEKMIKEITALSLSELSDEPIHETIIQTDNIKLLNTEKDVYEEGQLMSHCVFTNYRHRISEKKYIAFRMITPERCTIGITVDQDGNPRLDQAYKSHNRRCEDSTIDIIRNFVKENTDSLRSMFTSFQKEELIEINDYMPF